MTNATTSYFEIGLLFRLQNPVLILDINTDLPRQSYLLLTLKSISHDIDIAQSCSVPTRELVCYLYRAYMDKLIQTGGQHTDFCLAFDNKVTALLLRPGENIDPGVFERLRRSSASSGQDIAYHRAERFWNGPAKEECKTRRRHCHSMAEDDNDQLTFRKSSCATSSPRNRDAQSRLPRWEEAFVRMISSCCDALGVQGWKTRHRNACTCPVVVSKTRTCFIVASNGLCRYLICLHQSSKELLRLTWCRSNLANATHQNISEPVPRPIVQKLPSNISATCRIRVSNMQTIGFV